MKFLFITLVFLCTAFSAPHPLHVSIMQIDHNEENKTLEVTLKTFIDDFELGLKNNSGKKVFLNDMLDSDSSHVIIQKYLRKMISHKINSKKIELDWIGWEIEKDEVFFYYEIALPNKVKTISVQNDLLMKEYFDQVNIVHLKYKGENKSFLLEDEKAEKAFNFEN